MKAIRIALLAGAVIAAGLSAAQASPTNLVVNGDFEVPAGIVPAAGYYTIGAGAHSVPAGFGWTVPVNNVDIVSYAGAYGGNQPAGGGGNYFLDLVGTGGTGSIAQTLNLAAGTYQLSFSYANNPFSTSTASATVADLTVALNGAILHNTSTRSDLNWTPYTLIFTVAPDAAGLSALSFTETVGNNGGGVFLDNVSVTAVVPEPATWTLLLAGLAGLGVWARRRRRLPA